eukprot:m.122498 g.122498  ORF g.122498 m.122498 type:complete len:53 (-) comp15548_c0_seq1:105-263(-)
MFSHDSAKKEVKYVEQKGLDMHVFTQNQSKEVLAQKTKSEKGFCLLHMYTST